MEACEEIMKKIEESASTWISETVLSKWPAIEIANKKVCAREIGGNTFVTLPYYSEMEYWVAKEVFKRVNKPVKKVAKETIQMLIKQFEANESKKLGIEFKLAPEQVQAVILLVNVNFGILTGGPGTGKTSVLKALIYVIQHIDPSGIIEFTAPTGKAARRITESTGFPATTIQKKIGDRGEEEQESFKPIYADYLITDEVSMLDLPTFFKAIFSLGNNVRWYLVGDVDQLPSVGVGCVLRDLIDSNIVPVAALIKTFRQDNSSVLFENIQNIRSGLFIPLLEGPDFHRIPTEENVLENTINQYMAGIEKYGLEQTVVLTPYRKAGTICSEKLNAILQKKLNPLDGNKHYVRAKITRDERELKMLFIVGDPVIQLVNVEKVANGDVGKIINISGKKITVQYVDCIVDYYPDTYNQLDLAYALSIHKSQGSEYKLVILPFLEENTNLDRNMIYTGVTRAKKECIVIGKDKVIMDACKLQSAWKRDTALCEELQKNGLRAQFLAPLNQ